MDNVPAAPVTFGHIAPSVATISQQVSYTTRVGYKPLDDLLYNLRLPPNRPNLNELALRLSAFAGRQRPWTWRYLTSVLHGSLPPKLPLIRAIDAALAELDGMPALVAASQPATVHVLPGIAAEGAIIGVSARFCSICLLRFIPNHPARRKCFVCSPVQIRDNRGSKP